MLLLAACYPHKLSSSMCTASRHAADSRWAAARKCRHHSQLPAAGFCETMRNYGITHSSKPGHGWSCLLQSLQIAAVLNDDVNHACCKTCLSCFPKMLQIKILALHLALNCAAALPIVLTCADCVDDHAAKQVCL
eukprot:GHRQ01009310.1.p2 GENE.GHRQ01009310.1~~GHRQ01009310.1.p2  ORF type:complete len:135 (-),score=25.33 GHRQ01009310.1:203-607(-)